MKYENDSDTGLVFSTDQGRMCPECNKAVEQCLCKDANLILDGDGIVRVGREVKGRKGKGVTVISGILQTEKELKVLAKKLKQKCSTGGTVKAGVIEIQGDHRDFLIDELKKLNFVVKKSGA